MGHPRVYVNAHQASPDALRLAASLGVGGVRIDGNMEDLWPAPERWTHGWLDDILATCQTLRLEVYLTLSACPSWLSPNRGDAPPLHDWQTFCTEIAQRYAGRLTYVSCWNEWAGDSQTYVNRLLRPMSEAFRAVDQNYRICGPDLRTEGAWPEHLRDVLKYGGDCLDVVSIHNYKSTGADVWRALTETRPVRQRWIPSWVPWWEPSVLQVIQASGIDKPICVSEVGWNTAKISESQQAQYIQELLERFETNNQIEKIFLYQLIDEEPPIHWGLFRQDSSPKPCVSIIQSYMAQGVG